MARKKVIVGSEVKIVEEPAGVSPTPVVMTFDRWFAQTGKPAHHIAGMRAFGGQKIKGKRTVAQWDALFQSY